MRPEAKVGLIIFSAMVTIIVIYLFLGGLALRASSYVLYAHFRDVQTLDRGAPVRMAGVRIGYVEAVTLKGRLAEVKLRIRRSVEVPKGSAAAITTGVLVGEPYVDITPGTGPRLANGATVRSQEPVRLDKLLSELSGVVGDLRVAAKNVSKVLADTELVEGTKKAIRRLQEAASLVADAAGDVRGIVAENRPELATVLRNVDRTTRNVEAISAQLRTALATGGVRNIRAVLANAEAASASLASAARGIEDLARDPQIAGDVRASAGNIKEATEKVKTAAATAQEAVERANRLLGKAESLTERLTQRRRRSAQPSRPPVRTQGLSVDLLADTSRDEYRVDMNYDFRFPELLGLPTDPKRFYRIGLFDIGEDTRLNLQAGRVLDNRAGFRYGLYASRAGIGYDWWPAKRTSLHVDLFGLNEPQLEVKALHDVSNDWGVWLGLTDALDERDLLIGTRYKW